MNASGKVLVVDDERPLLEAVVLILESECFEVKAARSMDEAQEVARDWKPEVAVLDVAMPVRTGIDLAVWLHAKLPDVKVILYSAKEVSAIKALVGDFNVFGIIAKPFDLDELTDMVNDAWRQCKSRLM
jgi:DNA-binding response OmpR family regulator